MDCVKLLSGSVILFMKLLSGLLKTVFGIGTVAVLAVQCCAGVALLRHMPLAAYLLFGASFLITAGAACYFPLRRRRLISYILLFGGAALSCGTGVYFMCSPLHLPLAAFGWFHLSVWIPPLLAASGECFAKTITAAGRPL